MLNHLPVWQRKADRWLQPYGPIVDLLLVAILAVTLYMLIWASPTARTAWAVYMWAP